MSHLPDHPSAIVGLSTILLDIYRQKIPIEPSSVDGWLASVPGSTPPNLLLSQNDRKGNGFDIKASQPAPIPGLSSSKEPTPVELYRLAARDRAYGLLSSLTKLGTGWDYSEAWFALARAYEEGGQIEKAKGVLWWCIDLEDTKPLRGWNSICAGGYVL